MKKLLIILFLLPLASLAQFTQPSGAIIGRQTVISIPAGGSGTQQALAWFPPGYAANPTKRYPLMVFLHGAGQAGSKDITQILGDGLPGMIAAGLTPYGIDPVTKDTIWWIVVSPHCSDNNQCSYSYWQLQYTIPYLIQTYRVDTTCVWGAGLSAGGSGTWSLAMADMAFTQRYMTGIGPESNGGWDQNLAAYGKNLIYAAQHGLNCLAIIGSQDPGDNPTSYGAYQAIMKANCLPGHFIDSIVAGGIHNANVWNQPWGLNARVWSKTMNAWTQMWTMRRNATVVKPLPSIPHAVITIDSTVISYPNSVVHLTAGSSYVTNGAVKYEDFYLDSGDARVILSQSDSSGVCASGLRPGSYRFKLVVTDSVGNKDSAYAGVKVNGPVIPVCPPPVVCPVQRKVTAIQLSINGIMFNIPLAGTKISYDNGTSQP